VVVSVVVVGVVPAAPAPIAAESIVVGIGAAIEAESAGIGAAIVAESAGIGATVVVVIDVLSAATLAFSPSSAPPQAARVAATAAIAK
jgi:hypothetical protein